MNSFPTICVQIHRTREVTLTSSIPRSSESESFGSGSFSPKSIRKSLQVDENQENKSANTSPLPDQRPNSLEIQVKMFA